MHENNKLLAAAIISLISSAAFFKFF